MKIQFSRASEKIRSHFFSRFFEIETLVKDCGDGDGDGYGDGDGDGEGDGDGGEDEDNVSSANVSRIGCGA